MNRIILGLIFGGIALFILGIVELGKSPAGPDEPVKVELAELEKSGKAPATYLEIGPHKCRYDESLTYGKTKGDSVDWVMYPIVTAAAKDDDKAPLKFTVMVKTTVFRHRSDIPREIGEQSSVSGRTLSISDNFTSQVAEQIVQSYPGIQAQNLIIIEDGVSPSAARLKSMGMIAGGAALFVLGVGVVLYRRRQTSAPPAAPGPSPT